MSQPPFRMDPSAKFDDEIARLAAEHDADVTFRLVEREEQPMDSYCWVHDRDRPGEASHVATIDGPGPRDHAEVGLCYKHAMALHDHDYDNLAKDARPGRAANLQAADKNKNVTIKIDRLDRRPGKDPTIGLNPPHQEPRDPTIGLNPPGYDGGRLVELCPARFAQLATAKKRLELADLDPRGRERVAIFSIACNPALQTFGVVIASDRVVVVKRRVQRPPPRVIELSAPLFGKPWISGGDGSIVTGTPRRRPGPNGPAWRWRSGDRRRSPQPRRRASSGPCRRPRASRSACAGCRR